MIDQETLFQHILAHRWEAALNLIHQHAHRVHEEPLMTQAADTFLNHFFAALEADGAHRHLALLEKLYLLHSGGFFTLQPPHFDQLIAGLVTAFADRPQAALGYARQCPHHPVCAAYLQYHDTPRESHLPHTEAASLRLDVSFPAQDTTHTISLFKSQQEAQFFLAVREVFAMYLVYPNVALHTLFDFDHLRVHLTEKERRYFFRGLVDCVVFDQHHAYHPCFFFELDSALHDDASRQQRDTMKERILSVAGQRLYRIRPLTRNPDRQAYVTLLKEIALDIRA